MPGKISNLWGKTVVRKLMDHKIFEASNEQFQKKSTPIPWKVTRNSYREGGLKSQILEAKFATTVNSNFLAGRECKIEDLLWG